MEQGDGEVFMKCYQERGANMNTTPVPLFHWESGRAIMSTAPSPVLHPCISFVTGMQRILWFGGVRSRSTSGVFYNVECEMMPYARLVLKQNGQGLLK